MRNLVILVFLLLITGTASGIFRISVDHRYFGLSAGRLYTSPLLHSNILSVEFIRASAGCTYSSFSGGGIGVEWNDATGITGRYFRSIQRRPVFDLVIFHLGLSSTVYAGRSFHRTSLKPELGALLQLLPGYGILSTVRVSYSHNFPVLVGTDYKRSFPELTVAVSVAIEKKLIRRLLKKEEPRTWF